jgi:hypothetical protein
MVGQATLGGGSADGLLSHTPLMTVHDTMHKTACCLTHSLTLAHTDLMTTDRITWQPFVTYTV